MYIALGIVVWITMCSLILIGSSYAARFEDDYMDQEPVDMLHILSKYIPATSLINVSE